MQDLARTAEQRFSGLLEFVPDGVLGVDGQGRVVLANRQAEAIFGYSHDELVGQPVEGLIPERFRGSHVQHRADYLNAPRVRPMGLGRDLAGRRQDGSEFPAEISLSSVQLEEGLIVLVAVRDVTDRRRAEQALRDREKELERLRAEYVGFVSHDIRNPVGTISLHAELLGRSLTAAGLSEAADSARIIGESAARISAMVRELLDVQRLEAGHPDLTVKEVLPGEIVTRVVEHGLAPPDRARVRLEIPRPPAPLACDPERIERVVVNLVTNALRYSPAATEIVVSVGDEPGEVQVAVRDHGPGVAPDDRARIFDKYERTRSHAGKDSIGLGLFISRLIVEAHGGRIWVDGEPGQGSTFRFTLPRGRLQPSPAAPAAAAVVPSGRRVLVVDDETAACDALAKLLREEGYVVETAYGGADALVRLPEFHPEIAVLDVTMPKMTGIELMRRARQLDPSLKVVFMTGHERDSAELRAAGDAGYVSKPIDLDALLREMER